MSDRRRLPCVTDSAQRCVALRGQADAARKETRRDGLRFVWTTAAPRFDNRRSPLSFKGALIDRLTLQCFDFTR